MMKIGIGCLITLALILGVFGCGAIQPVAPAPECQDAIIVNSQFATVGKLAMEETWTVAVISERVPKDLMTKIATTAKGAVMSGDPKAVTAALMNSDLAKCKYIALVVPLTTLLDSYKLPTLHPCDQKFLAAMMDNLILISKGGS